MQCPNDKSELVMSDRQGIEIDYCPQCRGVWLDRGELDKIIERSESATQSRPQQQYQEPNHPQNGNYDKHSGGYSKKRRGSFLSELFD